MTITKSTGFFTSRHRSSTLSKTSAEGISSTVLGWLASTPWVASKGLLSGMDGSEGLKPASMAFVCWGVASKKSSNILAASFCSAVTQGALRMM
ncbi:hypothetical protein SDC9_184285 [bioreactor metagenome]|uniref:Uncharacterized protein n=1 Tax=bioreactor metagenome TaxID=1076179 RepID=A0A645HKW0_9ZZZZ